MLQEFIWREAWFIYDMTYMVGGVRDDRGRSLCLDRQRRLSSLAAMVRLGGHRRRSSFPPGSVIPYITSGPLALKGLWNFWIASPWWLIRFGIYSYYPLRHIRPLMRVDVKHLVPPNV